MPRQQVYEHFGPEMIHAMVILIVEQINILRVKAGLPEITKDQVQAKLKTEFDRLTMEL